MPTLTAAGTFVLGKDARVLLAPSLTIIQEITVLVNLLLSVCFATEYIYSGEIKD